MIVMRKPSLTFTKESLTHPEIVVFLVSSWSSLDWGILDELVWSLLISQNVTYDNWCNDGCVNVVESELLEEILGVWVDLERVGRDVESGDLWDVLVLSLTLLLLKLEGDTTDWSSLNSLHQMCRVSCNLVSESLRRDDRNFIADLLVGVEVQSQSWVELLDDDSRRSLGGLRSDFTHLISTKVVSTTVETC